MHNQQDSAGDERLMDLAQGVHDALGLDSSQRPAEEGDVEDRRPREILCLADLELHPVGQLGRCRGAREGDLLIVGIDAEDSCRPRRVEPGQPAVATADLEHTRAREVGRLAEDTSLGSLRVLDASQGTRILSIS